MPLSQAQLKCSLQKLRDFHKKRVQSLEQEYEAVVTWCKDVKEQIRTQNYSSRDNVLLPKTQEVPRVKLPVEVATSELQVTSTARTCGSSDSTGRRTLRSRKIRVEEIDLLEEENVITPYENSASFQFKLPTASNKQKKKQPTRSSKRSRKPTISGNDSIGQSSAEDLPKGKAESIEAQAYSYMSKQSTVANSMHVLEHPAKESIGANITYVKEGTPKESIGANSTYIKKAQTPKESIGANNTYVKEGIPKESIGANSTYITKAQTPEESIGANITYVKEGTPKESIGANSTYIKKAQTPKESIGANSTYTLETSKKAAEEGQTAVPSSSQLESDEKAKDEPTCTSQTETKSNPKTNADVTHKQTSNQKWQPKPASGGESRAAMKLARKSLNRAKFVILSKGNECNPGKVSSCSKRVQSGHFHSSSPSGSVALSHLIGHGYGKGIQSLERQRAIFRSDSKGYGMTHAKAQLIVHKGMSSSAVNCKDPLQELSAIRTPEVCKKKGELFQKQIEANKTKKRPEMHGKASRNEKEKAVLFLQAKEQERLKEAVNFQKIKDISRKFEVGSYDMTLDPEDRIPAPAKNEEDYGLNDVNSCDSSDNESQPKRCVPSWAQVANRQSNLHMQYEITSRQMFAFFESSKTTPDLTEIFEKIDRRMLIRRSSAVWHSP